MISITSTPFLPSEIIKAFSLSGYSYYFSLSDRALGRSCYDPSDPTRRIKLHNIQDAIAFSVRLTLGWPIIRTESMASHVESIVDEIEFLLEEVLESPEIKSGNIAAAIRASLNTRTVVTGAGLELTAPHICKLSKRRLLCLTRNLLPVVRLIYIAQTSADLEIEDGSHSQKAQRLVLKTGKENAETALF